MKFEKKNSTTLLLFLPDNCTIVGCFTPQFLPTIVNEQMNMFGVVNRMFLVYAPNPKVDQYLLLKQYQEKQKTNEHFDANDFAQRMTAIFLWGFVDFEKKPVQWLQNYPVNNCHMFTLEDSPICTWRMNNIGAKRLPAPSKEIDWVDANGHIIASKMKALDYYMELREWLQAGANPTETSSRQRSEIRCFGLAVALQVLETVLTWSKKGDDNYVPDINLKVEAGFMRDACEFTRMNEAFKMECMFPKFASTNPNTLDTGISNVPVSNLYKGMTGVGMAIAIIMQFLLDAVDTDHQINNAAQVFKLESIFSSKRKVIKSDIPSKKEDCTDDDILYGSMTKRLMIAATCSYLMNLNLIEAKFIKLGSDLHKIMKSVNQERKKAKKMSALMHTIELPDFSKYPDDIVSLDAKNSSEDLSSSKKGGYTELFLAMIQLKPNKMSDKELEEMRSKLLYGFDLKLFYLSLEKVNEFTKTVKS